LDWDGSMNLLYACADNGYPTGAFEFVGGTGCLLATVRALAEWRPQTSITVVKDATILDDRDPHCWHKLDGLNIMLLPGGEAATVERSG
jgi:hypothetical protein